MAPVIFRSRRVLKELGFEHVYVVPEQELPDGDFPTVSYPNPEADEAFDTRTEAGESRSMRILYWRPIRMPIVLAYVSKDAKTGEYHTTDRKYVRLSAGGL